MTYHHLWHRVHLSLSRSQAPVLLWTFNDQLLLWSFTSPSLHCQQLWWDFSALDPKEKRAASISNREKSWCWERSLYSHRLLLTPSFLRLLCLSESSGLTPRLRRWWPLLHSAVQPGGVKHPHTHTHTRTHTHTQWSNLTPHYPPARWHRVDKGKQKTHIPQVLQSGQGPSTPYAGQLK